ncbi:MAG TPA: DUF5995 family protein, partial [Polyangiaceae bacterium]
MALSKVARALDRAPAQNIEGVIGIMTAIDDALDDRDGVAWFNRLYLKVTKGVADAIAAGKFKDGPFIERLDVVFANYCFTALKGFLALPQTSPPAWWPLFEANERSLARLQFALAGMNAHINRDLMRAVVDVCQERNIVPQHDTDQKKDFDLLNPMLAAIEKQVHDWYLID